MLPVSHTAGVRTAASREGNRRCHLCCVALRLALTALLPARASAASIDVIGAPRSRRRGGSGSRRRAATSGLLIGSAAFRGQGRAYLDVRRQRLVDGAALRDREQARALRGVERAGELDLSLDALEAAGPALALRAVLRVLARVTEPDARAFEGPALLARVELQGHRGAAAERREQEVVGVRTGLRAARRDRLVAREGVRTRLGPLREGCPAARDDELAAGHVSVCPV